MIRRATVEDLELILELGKAFFDASPYGGNIEFDPVAVEGLVLNVLDNGVIFLSDRGIIAGVLNPLYFNPLVQFATEIAWYAEDGQGEALKQAFETWAKEQGAAVISFSIMNTAHMATLAKRLEEDGYAPLEVAYVKGVA